MGIDTDNKCLLLDEQDFDELRENPSMPFEEFVDEIADEAYDLIGYHDYDEILVEVLSVASERHGFVSELYDISPSFVCGDWKQSLKNIASSFGAIGSHQMARFMKSGNLEDLLRDQLSEVHAVLETQDYKSARWLLQGLETLKDIGLPGFRSSCHQSIGGPDEAYDLRLENHGSGTRILVEYAFLWP